MSKVHRPKKLRRHYSSCLSRLKGVQLSEATLTSNALMSPVVAASSATFSSAASSPPAPSARSRQQRNFLPAPTLLALRFHHYFREVQRARIRSMPSCWRLPWPHPLTHVVGTLWAGSAWPCWVCPALWYTLPTPAVACWKPHRNIRSPLPSSLV